MKDDWRMWLAMVGYFALCLAIAIAVCLVANVLPYLVTSEEPLSFDGFLTYVQSRS